MTRLLLTLLIPGLLLSFRAPQHGGGTLAEGTRFATPWVLIEGEQRGPTVFVVGGIHGDELAGARAAEAISHWSVRRGRLIVLPRANVPALDAGTRLIPEAPEGRRNLARHFLSRGPVEEGLAAEL